MNQAIPYYEQWLGPWAMAADSFLQTFDLFRNTDLHLHLNAQQAAREPRTLVQSVGQIAVIDLTGKLMKQEASMGGGTSTVAARRAIRAAAGSPDVSAILLRIDSPGGTAAGTRELADEIAAANATKPTWSYVEDMAASAAYWAASQSGRIVANATGIVGCIGTYGVVQDLSGYAAKEGVKVHVVRAGAYKGVGTPGTEITPDHLADMQRIVDGLNEYFLLGVMKGRGMAQEAVEEIADGRAWLAEDAKRMKLIDAVGSFDQALTELQTFVSSKRRTTMQASLPGAAVDAAIAVELTAQPIAETVAAPPVQASPPPVVAPVQPPTPKAATYAELKAGCPGADAAFICAQQEIEATIEMARTNWMAEQNRRIQQAQTMPGVEAVGTARSKGGAVQVDSGAIDQWESLVQEQQAIGKTRANAVKWCVEHHADAHLAYLAAHNAQVQR
jgi:signal peptide peptidase SppA